MASMHLLSRKLCAISLFYLFVYLLAVCGAYNEATEGGDSASTKAVQAAVKDVETRLNETTKKLLQGEVVDQTVKDSLSKMIQTAMTEYRREAAGTGIRQKPETGMLMPTVDSIVVSEL
eukprot:GHVU01124539.1.p1 GENE.GHVU01124539.1~~GHVU01124539.1.p1  ORF type:complete len:119 (+),score=15.48 GHVU01124539.1:63-419(+)